MHHLQIPLCPKYMYSQTIDGTTIGPCGEQYVAFPFGFLSLRGMRILNHSSVANQ